jgi:hypothetical protein
VAAARYATIDEHGRIEGSLPRDKRRSSVTIWGEEIFETDAPEWIAGERAVLAAFDADEQATCELSNVIPTTLQGIAALLAYATQVLKRGDVFCHLADDDESEASFEFFLMRNCSKALSNISAV